VFWAEASLGPVPSALRSRLAPLAAPLVPAVIGRRHLVAGAYRQLSQLGVNYRHSPLSVEGTPRRRGGPRAGDRLPDQLVTSAGRTLRLHELLAEADLTDDALLAETLALLRAHPALAESRAHVLNWAQGARNELMALPDVPARAAFLALCDFVEKRTG